MIADIAIIGGGPAGAALALALRDNGSTGGGGSGPRVTVLEARANVTNGSNDARPIALSHGSRLLLERLGAWHGLAPTLIKHIHVSQRSGFGRAALSAIDAGVPALGYVIDYNNILSTLTDAARAGDSDYHEGVRATALRRDGDYQHIDYTRDGVPGTLTARLVVVADGGDIAGLAPPKVINYAQHALTARVGTALPHQHVAYERFTPAGPLALLPFGEEMALVWTLTAERAQELKDADAKTFLAALQAAFGGRLGAFKTVAQRACYPLLLKYTVGTAAAGVVAIGNAAQTLHPVAGQGFNLGLRDAWELAQVLRAASVRTLAHPETVRAYVARRRFDRNATVAATHGLVRLFANDFFPLNALRGAAMTALGCIAPARDFLARRMIFGVRG